MVIAILKICNDANIGCLMHANDLLQYGVKIFVITSFKNTCYIEILPNVQRSKRGTITIAFASISFIYRIYRINSFCWIIIRIQIAINILYVILKFPSSNWAPLIYISYRCQLSFCGIGWPFRLCWLLDWISSLWEIFYPSFLLVF